MGADPAAPRPQGAPSATAGDGRPWMRRLGPRWRLPFLPANGAILFAWLALTPSLLPRSSPFQAVVVGVSAALGYGLGALVGWVIRSCGGRLVGDRRVVAWRVTAVVGTLGSVAALWWYAVWENDLRDMVGVDSIGFGSLIVLAVLALVLFVVLLLVSRAVKAAGRAVGRVTSRFLPARVATVVGGIVVAVLLYYVTTGVAGERAVAALDSTFMSINDEFRTDLPPPTDPALSAGPASGVSWDSLGRQGRVFIANAPTAEQISSWSGSEAVQPVRAYVGVGSDGAIDLPEEAQRAVDELERTGGFDRAVLNVATGTGRGWVNENQAQALEYMWNGDTATVSMQYSYLPSWMSFLVDGTRAQDAGRLLFDAVYGRWRELPVDDRPLLVVSGESLGSFGGEAAFSGVQDMVNRVDGALFVGPTNNNVLWSRFTAERDAGTPEVFPIFDGGAHVRFADRPEDWQRPETLWQEPRIGYLQHANDPITWWDFALAVDRPDWLTEPRGRNVSPGIRWIPVVTMLQLAVDQAAANSVPAGQGHQFGQAPVFAWAQILPPPGWSESDSTSLASTLARRSRAQPQ
jgi:uncharacterized membrane protein